MQFVFPGVLWGLLALSIPLIIHFFNFRRTKKVFFTNVAFLKKVETETSSFRKLKQWLIMAARMLFLACLVLAFAQPFLPSKNASNAKATSQGINSLYLDNSMSMQNTVDNKRYIDLAVNKIDELLALFGNQQNIQFLSNDFSADDQFAGSGTKTRERLADQGFSAKSRSFESIYKRQKNMAEKASSNPEANLFWFSDFQKSTSGDLKKLQVDSLHKLYLVPVQEENVSNVFIDSVWTASPFIREMQNTLIYVRVFNSGTEDVEKLPLKLFIDGTQTSTSSVSISPNASAIASFNISLREKGIHKGSISFEEQPVVFDNEYYFVLNSSPKINILHLNGEKSGLNYVKNLFSNDSLFNYQSFPASNVNTNRIVENDLLILDEVSRPDANLLAAAQSFVSKGGSIFIIPAATADPILYVNLLGSLGISGLSFTKDSTGGIELSNPDKTQAFFADVFEQSFGNTGIQNLPKVKPTMAWNVIGDKILTTRAGRTYLSQSRVATGLVYVLGGPLNSAYGNFAEHALFVPTMLKMAALSVKPQRLAYSFNEKNIVIPFQNAPKNAIYTLKNGDTEMIPIQRVNGSELILELPEAAQISETKELLSGYFDLLIDGKVVSTLAINHDNEESMMDVYTPNELQEIFKNKPNVTIFDHISDGDFIDEFAKNNFGKKLWKYFIYAALFFLLAEIALIRFWKK